MKCSNVNVYGGNGPIFSEYIKYKNINNNTIHLNPHSISLFSDTVGPRILNSYKQTIAYMIISIRLLSFQYIAQASRRMKLNIRQTMIVDKL